MQEIIKNEIRNRKMVMDECRVHQLEQILFELMQLEKTLHIILSYPRYIIDQWEFEDPLLDKLLEYAQGIERVQSRRK